MTLEKILHAAIRSMIEGHHAPHCFHAHVLGKGYVNDGSAVYDRADYLRQLEHAATSEVENMGYAPGYAGYAPEDQPAHGVVWANWNNFPRGLDTLLERAGYAVEWSDMVTTCFDCQTCIHTEPSHMWDTLPNYNVINDSYVLCLDCLQDYAQGERQSERDEEDSTNGPSL